MKKTFLTILCMCSMLVLNAQHRTEVYVTDLDNESLTSKVEASLTALLSELNSAEAEKRTPRMAGINISEQAMNSIAIMWENSPFRCMESEIAESALATYGGTEYEIRNIPLIFSELDKADQYHEVAVRFDMSGTITDFRMVIAQNLYYQVMKSNNQVTDFRRRQMILDFVEQFRTSYETKDMDFLQKVFSDDALIITGKVIKATKSEIAIPDKIEYKVQSKKEYLTNLGRVFKNNKRIRVSFDEIEVTMHPIDENFYGVTLHPGWSSDTYHDEGYLFLLWDFIDENNPQIHVRTWQPDRINGSRLPEDEIFSIGDFDI